MPITPKEKFSFLGVFLDGHDDKEALSRHMTNLHTEFADEVGIKYGLERGDSIKETGAEHRTTEEYRERLWKEAQQKKLRWRKTTRPSRAIKDYRYPEQYHGFPKPRNQTCGSSFEGLADYD